MTLWTRARPDFYPNGTDRNPKSVQISGVWPGSATRITSRPVTCTLDFSWKPQNFPRNVAPGFSWQCTSGQQRLLARNHDKAKSLIPVPQLEYMTIYSSGDMRVKQSQYHLWKKNLWCNLKINTLICIYTHTGASYVSTNIPFLNR